MRTALEIIDFFLFMALLGALMYLNAPLWVFLLLAVHGAVAYWEGLADGRH